MQALANAPTGSAARKKTKSAPAEPVAACDSNDFNDYSPATTGWIEPADDWLESTCRMTG